MGKTTKNFSLLVRRGNTGSRVPMKQLQRDSAEHEATTAASSTAMTANTDERRKGAEWDESGRSPDPDWTLGRSATLKILFSIRLSASLWSIISDCDEVYNYWEPLHLVLFGRGFQTWEYSPAYAIRSWLYIWLHALPAQVLMFLLGTSKLALFFCIRFLIGCLCLFSELALYESVCRRAGNSVGRCFLLFTLLSPAMFGASCAFLPSAFSMALNAAATAFYLREKWFLAIFLSAASALLGWPFAALLTLPPLIHMLLLRPQQLAIKFALYSVTSGTVLLSALATVDTHFFGKLVIAPLNIVMYNMFSGNGPNLYGTESFHFYVKNLLLNLNLALPLALFGLLCLFFLHACVHLLPRESAKFAIVKFLRAMLKDWPLTRGWQQDSAATTPFVLIALAACLWIVVFVVQPHKEERFLFPVYPHLCILAGIGLDFVRRCAPRSSQSLRLGSTAFCAFIALLFISASASRILAVHRNYAGLMDTYRAFNEHLQGGAKSDEGLDFTGMGNPIRLCVGKEWHRFPSSFFLPENVTDGRGNWRMVHMDFLRSEFRGILPKHFAHSQTAAMPLDISEITRLIPPTMNDENREEMDRYVPLDSCDFVNDLEDGQEGTALEPNYAKMPIFRTIAARQVLLPAHSHPIFRAFYIPFTESHLRFGTLHLLQRIVVPL